MRQMTPIAVTANCDVICGNWVKTIVHKRVHTADGTQQNCPVSNILRTTPCKLSATVANSVHTADETRQSSLVGVGGVN